MSDPNQVKSPPYNEEYIKRNKKKTQIHIERRKTRKKEIFFHSGKSEWWNVDGDRCPAVASDPK